MERIGIELEEAVRIILSHTAEIEETEMVNSLEAGGRILAEDIAAGFDNPPFPKSPLDGYALRSEETNGASPDHPVVLTVREKVCAGQWPKTDGNGQKQAVRIMTGAPIPEDFDCVVRQEDVTAQGDTVAVSLPVSHHENYCFQGEDFKKGTVLVQAGTTLNYIHLGIAASAGYRFVKVYRQVRAALFITGDEVMEPFETDRGIPGEPIPGKIYGSNLHLLYGRLKEMNVSVVKFGQLPDDPVSAAAAITEIADKADVIITTGGVSVGEKDIFHEVLPELGVERLFWKVRMKPGTPAMFSVFRGIPMLNLSGNPFAAITTFELLAAPLLAKLARDSSLMPRHRKAVLQSEFSKSSGSRRFIRGKLDGEHVAIPDTDRHASGILSSMEDCNCLVEIAAGQGALKAGQKVDVWIFCNGR